MNNKGWLLGLLTIALIFGLSIYYFTDSSERVVDDPWASVPVRPAHVDHTELMPGPYATGQEVTAACLACHEESANQVIHTTHWTWESEPIMLPGRDEPVTTGKKNSINMACAPAPYSLESTKRSISTMTDSYHNQDEVEAEDQANVAL